MIAPAFGREPSAVPRADRQVGVAVAVEVVVQALAAGAGGRRRLHGGDGEDAGGERETGAGGERRPPAAEARAAGT
ncbi:hypothetical protein [Streptomyces sp. H51]|uniref:hypothetical protein n=1 Tax=Streptomyces sp. H51 TaxID=3111770 RepID=UPI002D788D07|nr:hypothetical protein [Streptomyces sp. H51]